MTEFIIHYSGICNCYWVMRIPAWAIEMAGDEGQWTNDDGDSYVPFDMATIEGDMCFNTRSEAETYMATLEA